MIIKNKKDLEELSNALSDQGFGYMSDSEMHNKKVEHIINQANKLGISEYQKEELERKLNALDDYDEMKRVSEEHFSKYKPENKIAEYIKSYHIQATDNGKTPEQKSPSDSSIRNWIAFRDEYLLGNTIRKPDMTIEVYNLDKNIYKIRFAELDMSHSTNDFERLYKLVYGKDCPDIREKIRTEKWNEFKYGEWINLGEIEIKFFKNGYADIKGNLEKIKPYFIEYIKDHSYWYCSVIISNKQKTIIKASKKD